MRLVETTSAQSAQPQSGVTAITGEDLRAAYLTAPMMHYFRKKLAEVADDDLLARIEEALKYLAISRYCRSAIPVTREIDDIWHYWILQTQEYEQLCRVLPGGDEGLSRRLDNMSAGAGKIGAYVGRTAFGAANDSAIACRKGCPAAGAAAIDTEHEIHTISPRGG